jgi:predicted Ser/Thr protein kinase
MRHFQAGTMVGPYRIEGVLGRGGMATVYLATHESVGRPAALKLLDPQLAARDEFVRRFRREGRLQASLEHPHVVAVYETVETDDGLFIAMQLVRGPTLATLIAGGALAAVRAIALLEQIASAIDAAHAAGVVHRDVKPRNVLVAEGDQAYLADFGLTTLGDETGVTATGDVLGTVAYLAPEVIRGEAASPASDRYAFAAMAFECLTGSVVFPRPTQAAQLYAHTTEPVPRISVRRPELPEALDAVFERALAKVPEARPGSATEIVAAIRQAIGDELLARLGPPAPLRELNEDSAGSTLSPIPPLTAGVAPPDAHDGHPSGSGPRSRRVLVAAAVVVAAVAGTVAGAVAFGGDDDKRPQAVIPPVLPGASVLGSDLRQAGRTQDCTGGPVRPVSPACSILQTRLPEGVLVVPRNGVVRRWAVRSAVGELQLQVVRSRDGESFYQIAFSRSGFVADGQVHAFATDLAVEAGDLLSVHVVSGSGVGMRPVAGAAVSRWSPRLRGVPAKPNASGPAGELLLRVEYVPGGKQRIPRQIKGAAAAGLEPGKVVKRTRAKAPGLRPIDLLVVEVDGAYAVDLFHGKRRLARQTLPDFLAGAGEIVEFGTHVNEGDPNVELGLEYQRLDSTVRLSHYMLAVPREFEFIF